MRQNIVLILTLLMRGQTRLIKVALLALPVILLTVFFSVFIAHDLLSSFERHMEKSFFGVFGELQVAASPPFLQQLYGDPSVAKLQRSYRLTHKTVLLFEGESRSVLKGVDVIAYEADYLRSKFPAADNMAPSSYSNGYQPGTLILSSVAYNQLGGNENEVHAIINPADKRRVEFTDYRVIDFGFLGAQPIVVMSLEELQALKSTSMHFNEVEFNHVDDADINTIKALSERLMLRKLTNSYAIINPQTLTSEARNVFETVAMFKNLLSGFLILVSLVILWLALKLLLASKYASLQIIECIGVSRLEIGIAIALAIFMTTVITLLMGQQLALMLASYIKFVIGIPLV